MKTVWFELVPQILKKTVESLMAGKAHFEIIMSTGALTIFNVTAFSLRDDDQYHIGYYNGNGSNTNLIMIQRDNVKQFILRDN